MLLKNTEVILISSHAAHFDIDHSWRKNEEGYVIAMSEASALGTKWQASGIFKRFILEEPGLIDTLMARTEFTKETIGEDPDWDTIMKPREYAETVLSL